jgi:carbamoyltransferase
MLVLGLNAYHGDSSACILRDGILLAAVEEERFRRIKHWAGFPTMSIAECLRAAGAKLDDLDLVAINQDSSANLGKKLAFALTKRPDLGLILDRLRNKRERAGAAEELQRAFPGQRLRAKLCHIEHHLAHLASAHCISPFQRSTVVSVDGFGDFASAAWGRGDGPNIAVEGKVYFPHSLGIFYQALTQYLGFPHYGDEYKVMGLAPYGQPTLLPEMRKIVKLKNDGSFELDLRFFRHHREKVDHEWSNGEPHVGTLFAEPLTELLGPAREKGAELTQRHKDLARSVQAMYEEAFFHLLNHLHRQHGMTDLSLAGGCAMNSVANGRVYRNTPFTRVYVQSAAGDAGGAIGAAYAAWSAEDPAAAGRVRHHVDHAYLGPAATSEEIATVLAGQAATIQAQGCTVSHITDEKKLVEETAAAIADGLVIGWFQGRMEWGPRALGNRSILADPRRSDMKDILNLKIKRRESFRPFAPSVLREHVGAWFETEDDVPFMMQVYQIRPEQRTRIPAVTHVDGSGRLQTVYAHTNSRYHALIEEFNRLTGVPMVLNTSFNENEPVVCTAGEALACFLRTKMDLLVLNDHLIRRTA